MPVSQEGQRSIDSAQSEWTWGGQENRDNGRNVFRREAEPATAKRKEVVEISYLDTNTPAHPIEISNVIVAVQLVVWTHVEKAMQCGKNLGYRQRREIVKLTPLSGPARALLSLPRVS